MRRLKTKKQVSFADQAGEGGVAGDGGGAGEGGINGDKGEDDPDSEHFDQVDKIFFLLGCLTYFYNMLN